MKRALIAVITITFCITMIFGTALAADLKALNFEANTVMAKIGKDKVIVKAVKAQNKKGMTLNDIKAMDKKWKAEKGLADYQKALIDNECGQRLRELWRGSTYIAEIFVMDNMGANVCMTEKTGDYWQGDEAKFVKSFNGARGAVFVDEVELMDVIKVEVSQVSVPVIHKGEAIGAITIGVYVGNVK